MVKKGKVPQAPLPSLFAEADAIAAEKGRRQRACIKEWFLWSQVEFDKNVLRLHPVKHIYRPLELPGSLQILNSIKKEYFERLFPKPIVLYFDKSKLQEDLSPDWPKIKALIEPAVEYYDYKFATSRHLGKFRTITKAQVEKIYQPVFEKNEYLKFLASKQSEHHSIIPIIEKNNSQEDESFIFRLKPHSERIIIAWENSKEGRATHLFIADETNLDERLNLVESYIVSDVPFKRSTLHSDSRDAKKVKKDLIYIGSINHQNINQYEGDLTFVLGNY